MCTDLLELELEQLGAAGTISNTAKLLPLAISNAAVSNFTTIH
jgi:hypothetical protein